MQTKMLSDIHLFCIFVTQAESNIQSYGAVKCDQMALVLRGADYRRPRQVVSMASGC